MKNYLYRIFCVNKNCSNQTYITKNNKSQWIRDDKSLFDSIGVEYETLECSKCHSSHPNIFDINGECVFNKNEIKYCNRCNGVIPLARLKAMPKTNMCSVKCIEDQTDFYNNIEKEKKIWPSIPEGYKKCTKCESDNEVAWSENNKEFYIRCSTIPKCRKMIPMPKKIHTNFGSKYYNILSSYEDLMKIALEARKNKDLKTLKDISIEFSSRVSLKEFKEKNPTKTSLKGEEQTKIWIKELENKL